MHMQYYRVPCECWLKIIRQHNYSRGSEMKKLKREIERNNCQLTDVDVVTKKVERKALVDGLLDTVSGGWVNAFVNWPKRF